MDRAEESFVPGLERVIATSSTGKVAGLLAHPRYEVIPLAGAEEAVLEHVPSEVTVTITTSPRKGLEPTLELTERLSGHGYDVVPHLAARHVRDRGHLAELVERLRTARTSDVLVMAGDAEEPAGEFDGSLPLLEALAELGRPFRAVGITGYPESRAFVSAAETMRSLVAKERYATYVVSQICFDPQVIATWAGAVRQRGTRLPIHIGLPGPVPREKLLRISTRIGVGDSIRFLQERGLEGEFDPDPLVRGLAEALERVRSDVGGFHVFTFNDLQGTERWRQRALERLRGDG